MIDRTSERQPIPVIVHLSGARRGTTQRLRGESLTIGTGPDVDVHVAHELMVATHHATLIRRDASYAIETDPEHPVWVNGQLVERQQLLATGDVLEIGRDGPVLRYRLYPPGSKAYKTPSEAFSDGLDRARYSSGNPVGRAATFLTQTPKELVTQTSGTFRAFLGITLILLIALVGLLVRSYFRLERRLAREESRITGIREWLDSSEAQLTPDDLAGISATVSTALERVEALEARTGAAARVVASASRSVAFLQGSYGFIEPQSGRPLRFAGIGPDGQPLRDSEGAPLVGLDGNGPMVEAYFTGTGFLASAGGILLTNKHVAVPWGYDEAAQDVIEQGLLPSMRRFLAYLPGQPAASVVSLISISETADLAALQCWKPPSGTVALPLASSPATAGDEVLVLGYPTGIRALLARADTDFVAQLSRDPATDFWSVAARLAAGGYIAPLASRGIVAQVSSSMVAYDAETTRGGSGGPVLDLEGNVVAINSAIVPEFGGSNLGVPVDRARRLLWQALITTRLPWPAR